MNDQQKQAELTTVLKDLAIVLKTNGMADHEVDQTLLKLVTEVEMAVVEEILAGLPAEKRKQFEELSEQDKPLEELAPLLQLDPEKVKEIETRTFEKHIRKLLDDVEMKR